MCVDAFLWCLFVLSIYWNYGNLSLEDDEYCGPFITQEPCQSNESITDKSVEKDGDFLGLPQGDMISLCVSLRTKSYNSVFFDISDDEIDFGMEKSR